MCVCVCACIGVELTDKGAGEAAAQPESLGQGSGCPGQLSLLWLLSVSQGQWSVLIGHLLQSCLIDL